MGSPKPERRPSSAALATCSCGIDCQTRSVSAVIAPSRCHRRSAPSHPSLSWTEVTPRALASLRPTRIASRYSPSGTVTWRALNCQAASSRRIPVGSPASSRSTTPPATSRSPPARCERGRVQPERVVVLRDQRGRDVARHRVEVGAGRLAPVGPVAAPPPVPAQPAAVSGQPATPGRARRPAASDAQPSRFTSVCASAQVGKWT